MAVTGLGAVTPIGNDARATWDAAVAGRSGIDFIQAFDASDFPVRIAGEVKDFDATGVASPKEVRKLERNVLLALGAGREAVADAGLEGAYDPSRVGILFGTAIGGLIGIAEQAEVLRERGHSRVSPTFIPSVLADTASGQLAISLGFRGPNYAPVSACATGSHAVGEAAEMIRRGAADAVLAGGAEACIHPLILAGFCAMRGLVAEDEHPERASRPFDATRAGFVMGEGACILVLEDMESAQKRGARIYAEILGYGSTNDAYHMTAPLPDGRQASRSMRLALADAKVAPHEIDYINAHGSSTPLNDPTETLAIKQVFGDHAPRVPISGTKGYYGHALGASGAIEAAICALSLTNEWVPPTVNLDEPDAACDLDYVPRSGRPLRAEHLLTNSFGFGGINASLVMRRAD